MLGSMASEKLTVISVFTATSVDLSVVPVDSTVGRVVSDSDPVVKDQL